jgi:hypothetical protein
LENGHWLLARRVHTIDPAYFELAKSWAAAPGVHKAEPEKVIADYK